MNGLKRCVLAGMASCLLMMPGFSLAEGAPGSDVTTQAAAAVLIGLARSQSGQRRFSGSSE